MILPRRVRHSYRLARLYYRSNGTWNCPITIRTPYGAGIHGGPYHSQSVEAFYAHVPGLWGEFVFACGTSLHGSSREPQGLAPQANEVVTRLLRARHGATSGVRGAAWLWPVT